MNIQNFGGDTALIAAVRKKHHKCAEILIKAGADVNIENNNYKTAL